MTEPGAADALAYEEEVGVHGAKVRREDRKSESPEVNTSREAGCIVGEVGSRVGWKEKYKYK